MPAGPTATVADRVDQPGVHPGHAVTEKRQVLLAMIAEDVLDYAHVEDPGLCVGESTPRINWSILRRESSLPWVVMCR